MSSELGTLTKIEIKSKMTGAKRPIMTSSPNHESIESSWQSHDTPRWEFEESDETLKPTENKKSEGSITIESTKSTDIMAEVKHHSYDETSSSFLGEVSQTIGPATMDHLVRLFSCFIFYVSF